MSKNNIGKIGRNMACALHSPPSREIVKRNAKRRLLSIASGPEPYESDLP